MHEGPWDIQGSMTGVFLNGSNLLVTYLVHGNTSSTHRSIKGRLENNK